MWVTGVTLITFEHIWWTIGRSDLQHLTSAWIHHEVLHQNAVVKRVSACWRIVMTAGVKAQFPGLHAHMTPTLSTFCFLWGYFKPTLCASTVGVEFNNFKLKQGKHTESSIDCESLLPELSCEPMNKESISSSCYEKAIIINVACRAAAIQRLRHGLGILGPFLSNCLANTFPLQQTRKH
jgi:hypothetical protein